MGLTLYGGSSEAGITAESLVQPTKIPGVYVHHEDPTALLKYAKARGFTAITYSELVDALEGNFTLPRKPYLLSGDDEPSQWAGATDAALATYGSKMTGFISTGYPDGETMDGGSDPFFGTTTTSCTWAQLRTLRDTGRWDFQNHSRTHVGFNTLTTQQRTDQWTYSQARIQAELGVTPRVFQHPKDAHTLTTVKEAFAHGFKVVGIGPKGYATLETLYGPANRTAAPLMANRSHDRWVHWRADTASASALEDVWEPVGNRIPNEPHDDNSLGIWTVSAGTEASASHGVRFDQPDKSAKMDFRSNGSGNVTAITTHYIAVKPSESILFGYMRECGVGGATFVVTIKEYDYTRAFQQDVTFESNTGTVSLDDKEAIYTPTSSTFYVKIQVSMVGAAAASYGIFQLPFFGAIR